MDINTTLYKLDDVLESLNHAQIIDAHQKLVEVMNEMIEEKKTLVDTYVPDFDDSIIELELQLSFLEKNVKTFNEALLYCESLVFDFIPVIDGLEKLCLN